MMKITIATERSELHRLSSAAIRAGKSQKVSDVERCFDILRYLKKLNLSVKDLCHSKAILPLANLRDHENPKIRMEANELFNSWMKIIYSSGRNSSLCNNKAIPLKNLKKPNVVKVCSALKNQKKSDYSGMKKNEDEIYKAKKLSKNPRSDAQETGERKQNLKKPGVICKSVPATSRPLQMKKKKQPSLKVSENPKPCPALKKKQPSLKVSENPKPCPVLKKNSTDLLELFEIAKKSADVANAKGLLAATAETSICVDTLSLLVSFPISSTATETRRIMERLERLTKHKDRKICNSALALLHHWRQSIKDQQH